MSGINTRAQRGAVTAEFAVTLPVVVSLALLLCSLGRAIVLRVECQDAARDIAQQAVTLVETSAAFHSDGTIPDEFLGSAQDSVRSRLGAESDVSIMAQDGGIEVIVSAPVMPDPLHVLPTRVSGEAYAYAPR